MRLPGPNVNGAFHALDSDARAERASAGKATTAADNTDMNKFATRIAKTRPIVLCSSTALSLAPIVMQLPFYLKKLVNFLRIVANNSPRFDNVLMGCQKMWFRKMSDWQNGQVHF